VKRTKGLYEGSRSENTRMKEIKGEFAQVVERMKGQFTRDLGRINSRYVQSRI